jgi:hypothetical protein
VEMFHVKQLLLMVMSWGHLLLRALNSLRYREGHEVFSGVTCPVEYGSDHACGSVNKLGLGNKHSSNEVLTLQG